ATSIGHQGLKPLHFKALNVAAEAATYKNFLSDRLALLTSRFRCRSAVARLFRGGGLDDDLLKA
ncbi:MAG TPA: hypothetical protein VG272_09560, partial [Candidatus Acidoferrales bacterium]|nr:hypothetical protein [Candidatus Acidoferrales bacterium]